MMRFSIEDLTRVLRALLAEKCSIRDLRSILEKILLFETIAFDTQKFIVVDDRLAVTLGATILAPDSWA